MMKQIRPDNEEESSETVLKARRREEIARELHAGHLDNITIEIEVADAPKNVEVVPGSGQEINIGSIFGDMLPKKKKKRRLQVRDAMTLLENEEASKLIDMDDVNSEALRRAEQNGIIFIDEMDKIAGKSGAFSGGPDVSREGVQRDILPIVEGSQVSTKYGPVRTDHILFIAAGAFHVSKPSDLIPELQGRFPIRVELQSLTVDDFRRILTEPNQSLVKQYKALLETDGVTLEFTDDGIDAIAEYAYRVNLETENIGARRLHTILEKILEDVAYEAPDIDEKHIVVNKGFVSGKLNDVVQNVDLSHYIL